MSCGHTKFEGSPPCPCDRQNTTKNGMGLTGDATVSLVDYGVLKERARIVGRIRERGVLNTLETDGYGRMWIDTDAFIRFIEGETK
jgi:hypothetical protein